MAKQEIFPVTIPEPEFQDRRRGAETGIYIACSDRALLDTINSMLNRKGIIGISDAEGKYHYLVDGRHSARKVISRINDLVVGNATVIADAVPDDVINSVLKSILVYYDFDMSLIGTSAIFEIVRRMVVYRDMYFMAIRELYAISGELLGLSYYQTERDIRYALKKSSFNESGIKTTRILRMLADDVNDRIKALKRQPV